MSEPNRDPRELLRQAFDRGAECPPLESLTAATIDTAVQQHLESCAHCRAELALFQQFEGAEPRAAESADLAWVEAELSRRIAIPKPTFAERFRGWFDLPRLTLVAAALLVLIAVGLYLPTRNGGRSTVQQELPVWRSGQIAAVAPIGDLEHAPSQLRWELVTGAASYHVRLLEVDGTEIWSADSNATTVEIPGAIEAKMTAARAFQWEAAARDATGRQIATTNLQSFHIVATSR
jgi:hypothetical protein